MRVKLDKVCKRIYAGGDVPKGRYSTVKTAEYAIPIYANAEKDNGLYGYTDTARENELSITVAARGTIGFTAIRREPFLPVVRLITVVPDLSTVSERYLYYALRNCKPAFSGTSIPQLTVPDIKKNEIELYSLSVQETIADKLDAVGRIIELRQQQLQKLDDLVKARFVEMFGDPVTNPMDWPTKPLLEMGYCKNGMNFHTGDSGIEMHCLGVGDFKDYSVIDGTDYLPTISLNEAPPEESMLQDGDLVFVRSNGNKALVGRCLLVYPHNTPTTYSGFCIRYRLTSAEVNIAYLLRVLKTDSMRKKMAGRGANIQNLNQQILATLNIPTPPLELQEWFTAFIEQIDKSKAVEGLYSSLCL